MLSINNLSKSFDGTHAVDNLSLLIPPQKITSLIGPNGAGKSTVFNTVTGFLVPDSGAILYQGRDITGREPHVIARSGMVRTFQNLRLFKKMTVKENVLLGIQNQDGESFLNALVRFSKSSGEHLAAHRKAEELLEFVGLLDKSADLAENLSYGQQKLLSIVCCLATDPKLLLLDEPVSGVQPEMIKRIESILRDLVATQGKTVFLIEHDIEFVLRMSDTVVVMDEGKKIMEAPPAEIRDDAAILEAYLS